MRGFFIGIIVRRDWDLSFSTVKAIVRFIRGRYTRGLLYVI